VIADVVFDLPVPHPFFYLVPSGLSVLVGQRVSAPLHGRGRVGLVVGIREGDAAGLRPIERTLEAAPIASRAIIELGRWAAGESLSSWGSALLSLLPPAPARGAAEIVAPPPEPPVTSARLPEVWMDGRRHARLLDEIGRDGTALVIAPDLAAAARWARQLDAARLDSGASVAARRAAWFAAARGRARVVVGTRSALLVPLPPPATVALLDEHDPAHKPPGAPRIHSRDLLVRRAALEGSRLILVSATPSAESWWHAGEGRMLSPAPGTGEWPEILTSSTRGILRNHPLTLPLTRAIETASRDGRRVALIVTRKGTTLLCAECGHPIRCASCGVALMLVRAERRLRCRLCVRDEPLPDHCPSCGGHRLGPLGWDAERVEASVRRRFPKLSVSRSDPRAQVAIGPPGLLRTVPPGTFGAVGVVALDAVLGAPDFRAGERAFALLWAAAEAAGPRGRVVVQTLHPEHYALQAVSKQLRADFYGPELAFRAELSYPPFSRLCIVSARGKTDVEARALADDCARAVTGVGGLTTYQPAPRVVGSTKSTRWQFVIKGPADLPHRLSGPLGPYLEQRRRRGGVVDVEMDPV
jgi:primosomal protein N' (replication factor Y)